MLSQIQLQQMFTGKESIVLESLAAVVVLRYFAVSERKICVQKENKTIKKKKKKKEKKTSDNYYLNNRTTVAYSS